MKAYYFSNLDKKLRYNDKRVIEVGITHEVKFPYTYEGETFEKPTLCKAGLHGSIRAIDAIKYAPGEFLWIVDIEGDIEEGEDKICGTHRKYIDGFDATELLRSFAKKVALINIEKIKPYCTEKDYDIILRVLNGEETLRSAAYSAANTAYSAAYFAANTATNNALSAANAARYAALSAANAARYAAWYAARCAAQDTAESVEAYDDMNQILEEMIKEELERM